VCVCVCVCAAVAAAARGGGIAVCLDYVQYARLRWSSLLFSASGVGMNHSSRGEMKNEKSRKGIKRTQRCAGKGGGGD
jgi:hypothetical protein